MADDLTLSAGDFSVLENEGILPLLIRRDGDLAAQVEVFYSTSDGTAVAGEDFVALSGSVILEPGEAEASVDLSILDDNEGEYVETLEFSIDGFTVDPDGDGVGVGDVTLGTPATATLSIIDETDLLALGADAYSVPEDAGSVSVVIQRTGDLAAQLEVFYSTQDDSALAGIDYTATIGSVILEPGVGQAVVEIPLINDAAGESTESFGFTIESFTIDPDGDGVGVGDVFFTFPRTANISILDDEIVATPSANPSLVSEYDAYFEPVFNGLRFPIAVEFASNGLAYVAEKGGVIKTFDIATGAETATFIDISDEVNEFNDRGLLDIALHPDFPNNPYIYAFYVVDPADLSGVGDAVPDGAGNRYSHLVRFEADAATGYQTVVPGSETLILGGAGQSAADISGNGELDFTSAAFVNNRSSERNADGTLKQDYLKVDSISHAGGSLAFAPDGSLFVGVGDGTSFNYADRRTVDVQNLDSLSGKVLRIDPDTGLGMADNPFVTEGLDLDSNRAKVYQLGLRHAFAIAVDDSPEALASDPLGRLFVSETGWFSWEEINTGPAGANFGWPYYEGRDSGVLGQTTGYRNLSSANDFYADVEAGVIDVFPAYRAFAHSTDAPGYQVQGIVGADSIASAGFYPATFDNDYFFTDVSQGEVFSVDINDRQQVNYLLTTASGFGPVHFKEGPDGAIYYADLINGEVGRLVVNELADGIIARVDDSYDLYVNGTLVLSDADPDDAESVLIDLQPGDVVAVHALNTGDVGGAFFDLNPPGEFRLGSSSDWLVSTTASGDWTSAGYDDSGWAQATEYGGPLAAPWVNGPNGSDVPRNSPGSWIWTADNVNDDEVFFRYVIPDNPQANTRREAALTGPDLVAVLNGASSFTDADQILTLTPAESMLTSSAIIDERFDLTQDFTVSVELNFGDNPPGSDGIALLLHNDPFGPAAIGGRGSDRGFRGVLDGFAAEFATSGSTTPSTGFADSDSTFTTTPFTLGAIEDGAWHRVDLFWDAGTGTLSYLFDDAFVASFDDNLINTYLGGSNNAFFGLTAGTGSGSNLQQARFLGVEATVGSGSDGQREVAWGDVPTSPLAPDVELTGPGLTATLNGAASFDESSGIFTLTPAATQQVGSAMLNERLDLAQDFILALDLRFGDTDTGADGMALVLHDDPNGAEVFGSAGTTGFTGFANGLGIDFDTHFNFGAPGDIASDHSHFTAADGSLLSPSTALANLEDGALHRVVVNWDATAQSLVYSVDGETIGVLNEDIATAHLGGSGFARFGVTGGTGGGFNPHQATLVGVDGTFEGGQAVTWGDVPPPPMAADVELTGPGLTAMLNGSASFDESSGIFTLTPAAKQQVGSAMLNERLDLAQDFTLAVHLFLGTDDAGADGMALVLHNDPAGPEALGIAGTTGFTGLADGFAIDLDTYLNNGGSGDIPSDHTNFARTDGTLLTTPSALANLEDGAWHRVVLSWDAAAQKLIYSVDGVTVGTLSEDIATAYLGGESFARFGVTAGTGGAFNTHQAEIVGIDGTFEGGRVVAWGDIPPPPPEADVVLNSSGLTATLNGSATFDATDGVFALTPDQGQRVGSAMLNERLDLSQDFEIALDLAFGTEGAGADGMALVLYDDPDGAETLGSAGTTGFTGFANGLGIDFDTHFNFGAPGDIANDHSHFAAADGSVLSPSTDLGELEDGAWHRVVVNWDATAQTLVYSVDGVTIGTLDEDIAANHLGGSSFAHFGITGGTGGSSNTHEARFMSVAATLEDGTAIDWPTTSEPVDLVWSASSDRSDASDLDAATLAEEVFVFLDAGERTDLDQVSFFLNDPTMQSSPFQVENNAPWDFRGGSIVLANAWNTVSVDNGDYTITAEALFDDGSTVVVTDSFNIDNVVVTEPDFDLRWSVFADRQGSEDLEGAVLDGDAYVFLDDGGRTDLDEVLFYLNDPNRQNAPYQSEGAAPWDFAGTSNTGGGVAVAWDTTALADGEHTITAEVRLDDGSTEILTDNFAIDNFAEIL